MYLRVNFFYKKKSPLSLGAVWGLSLVQLPLLQETNPQGETRTNQVIGGSGPGDQLQVHSHSFEKKSHLSHEIFIQIRPLGWFAITTGD